MKASLFVVSLVVSDDSLLAGGRSCRQAYRYMVLKTRNPPDPVGTSSAVAILQQRGSSQEKNAQEPNWPHVPCLDVGLLRSVPAEGGRLQRCLTWVI
jgi:hypothetical protein